MSMSWEQLSNKLIAQAKEKGVPISGQFELTARCNLSCKMCYVCKPANDRAVTAEERSAKDWIRLAEEARDAGMFYLLLTGGEVFLRKDFKEIYTEISMMGVRPVIYTNATMITTEIAKWLGRIPPSRMEVTLYGASPETYGRVCGCSAGYAQTVRGIELLRAEGIDVRLRTTVIRENAGDYDKIQQFADDRDVMLKFVYYISPRRDECGIVPDQIRLSPGELAQYTLRASHDFAQRIGVSEAKKDSSEKRRKEGETIEGGGYPFKCNSGKNSFWVTWNGHMTPCALMDTPRTFPFEKGFSAAWKELYSLCSSVPVCGECRDCSLKDICLTCPARLKSETGLYDRPAAYLCEFAREWKMKIPQAI